MLKGAGRPVFFLGPEDSEAACMVGAHDCGTVHPALSARALARTIQGGTRCGVGGRPRRASADGGDGGP